MTENSNILSNLLKNQRQNISLDKKLSFKDLNRISCNLSTNIFTNTCSIWNGYITNINSKKKNCYISFFFKNKKVSLHRLLFANYVEDINDTEYIKYTCNNKGKCCTINHMKKTLKEEQNKEEQEEHKDEQNKEEQDEHKEEHNEQNKEEHNEQNKHNKQNKDINKKNNKKNKNNNKKEENKKEENNNKKEDENNKYRVYF